MGAVRGPRIGGPHGLDPVATRRVIDWVGYVLAFATFIRLGDSEILLHAWWVTIAIGAFVYGLRIAFSRIAVSAVVAIGYASATTYLGLNPEMEPLDFTEWPLMVIISLVVAVMADMLSSSAKRYASLYRQASDRLHTAHEDERARLARDLHDGVGQTLTAVVLTLDAAEAALRSGPEPASEQVETAVRRAQVLAVSALEEARDVAARLRPTRIHEIGLGAALRNLADQAGIPVDARLNAESLPVGVLDQDREIDAYRIVQEAIGNAARHSGATRVWIDGQVVDGEIRVEVGDNGTGFDDTAHGRGLGLDGMAERATLLNARLEIDSRLGEGTVVRLAIPSPEQVAAMLAATASPIAPTAR